MLDFAMAWPSELTLVTLLKVFSILGELAPPRSRHDVAERATIWQRQLFASEAT